MKITERIKLAYNVLRQPTARNTMGSGNTPLGRQFLKYGNQQDPLYQDWSQILMSDESLYTGYLYAALNNRANAVAQLAEENLKTSGTAAVEKAVPDDEELRHPYLDLIDESPDFSAYKFWYGISGYLDLKGVYYLLAVRNKGVRGRYAGKVGAVQSFELLNPYDVKRLVNKETGEVVGYVEYKNDNYREIPVHMIIEMRKFNPFSSDDPLATVTAAKDAQFTLAQSGDFTRHAIKNNINSPGIIKIGDSDLMLSKEDADNFKARILGHTKGEPIFAVGDGSLAWDPMQIDLDKSALPEVNEANLNAIIAVTGNSRTMFGIEQSGVTRDTAKVQRDLFTGNHAIPQLKLIIDALNRDYRTYYKEKYASNKLKMFIDSPLKVDRDAELKDTEIQKANYEMYSTLVAGGFEPEIAAKFVAGKMDLEALAQEQPDLPDPVEEDPPKKDDKKKKDDKQPDETDDEENNAKKPVTKTKTKNDIADDNRQGLINQQQAALQNTVINLEGRIVASVVSRVEKKLAKNDVNEDALALDEKDLMPETEKRSYQQELAIALAAFYGVIFLLWAPNVNAKRLKEFELSADYKLDAETKKYIQSIARKVGDSHIETVLSDLLVDVRKQALTGASQQEIVSSLTKKYADISKTRATAIARTETNRAFTMTQFEYDRQFVKQNNLEGKAFKVWHTRTDNPCPFCTALAARGEIPFDEPFADIGDELTATSKTDEGTTKVHKMVVAFDTPIAGNLHVNCGCDYTLIIKN